MGQRTSTRFRYGMFVYVCVIGALSSFGSSIVALLSPGLFREYFDSDDRAFKVADYVTAASCATAMPCVIILTAISDIFGRRYPTLFIYLVALPPVFMLFLFPHRILEYAIAWGICNALSGMMYLMPASTLAAIVSDVSPNETRNSMLLSLFFGCGFLPYILSGLIISPPAHHISNVTVVPDVDRSFAQRMEHMSHRDLCLLLALSSWVLATMMVALMPETVHLSAARSVGNVRKGGAGAAVGKALREAVECFVELKSSRTLALVSAVTLFYGIPETGLISSVIYILMSRFSDWTLHLTSMFGLCTGAGISVMYLIITPFLRYLKVADWLIASVSLVALTAHFLMYTILPTPTSVFIVIPILVGPALILIAMNMSVAQRVADPAVVGRYYGVISGARGAGRAIGPLLFGALGSPSCSKGIDGHATRVPDGSIPTIIPSETPTPAPCTNVAYTPLCVTDCVLV